MQMARRTEPHLHGLLVVDKPAGITSHDVVARIRRFTGERRVGHAGTLDPFATGIVLVGVGRATRMMQYVQDADKVYLAHIVLGAETDSCDVDGQVVERMVSDSWPEQEQIDTTLAGMIGTIIQIPPVYSAIKVDGQPLYRQARAGKDVSAPPRTVEIHDIELVSWEPPDLVIGIHCGKGTYIRSIARDLGTALGTFGYCHGLRRLAIGHFGIEQAWTLDELAELDVLENWNDVALHPDMGVLGEPAIVLSEGQRKSWYFGQTVTIGGATDGPASLVRVYEPNGHFTGLGELTDEGTLRPALVFPVMDEDSTW